MGNVIRRRALRDHDNDYSNPEITELSFDEIEIVQKSWKIPASKVFIAFRNTPLLMLKGTPGFRAHASRIFNVFSSVIDALDKDPDMEGIKHIVAEVGRSHAKRQIKKRSYVELRIIILEVISEMCKLDDDGIVAWSKLLDIIYHILFECIDGRDSQFSQ
uniref:Globin n=1 Tax=Polypedilum nubifer TaxID=54969 RepID=V5YNG2_9DIPT|nr:globin [Polypedilum nubifer]